MADLHNHWSEQEQVVSSSFHLPESEGMGRWLWMALFIAILLHIAALLFLSFVDIDFPSSVEEIQTEVIRVRPVIHEDPSPKSIKPSEPLLTQAPPLPPIQELELLANLPEMEIDVNPAFKKTLIPQVTTPPQGELEALDTIEKASFDSELPEMGKTPDAFAKALDNQVIVDPGQRQELESIDSDAFVEKWRKGVHNPKTKDLLNAFSSLDDMASMDGNTIQTHKAMIASDLLFDFNSDQLRQSARVSLMKVALLIDKHPDLVCWVDGHTDLIGSQSANMPLSLRRASAVKNWLIKTLDVKENRIAIRGFGKSHPIVQAGDVTAQAPNRRVEIKFRKTQPKTSYDTLEPTQQTPLEEAPPPLPQETKSIHPPKAIPLEETPPSLQEIEEPAPPKAIPVEE